MRQGPAATEESRELGRTATGAAHRDMARSFTWVLSSLQIIDGTVTPPVDNNSITELCLRPLLITFVAKYTSGVL